MQAFKLTESDELIRLARQLNYVLTHLGQNNFVIDNWIVPTLQNGWVNYNSATHTPVAYRKDPLGVVHIRGYIKDGTVANQTPIFTLPVGYRPVKVVNPFGVDTSAGAHGRVDVDGNNGYVFCIIGSNTYVSLNGIYFLAEN